MATQQEIRELVQRAYGQVAAGQLNEKKEGSCCSSDPGCCVSETDASYRVGEEHPLPQSDLGLSCGNPVAFSMIKPGDVVLDLGSGAGRDVFMAAARVGPEGRAIGVDMTPHMLELARKNAARFAATSGMSNVEFREGFIEALPVADAEVDLVISNCVINLSVDKPQVFREAFRVLKPGGRIVVSDIVLNHELSAELANDPRVYANCISGALLREDYLGAISAAGFAAVEILDDHLYNSSSCCGDPITGEMSAELEGCASSITVLARKD
ncbi:arsenite methyltransferase [bacterium]|nr:arsenite methyltransferase [bacterium]